ncbi:S8 family serine peptidase, partial [Bacillus sp. JJ1562]|uniref:S8 family serine peptidase n=1 Tax=Bacillus sp. JJ1562 TaxID=3122960 RepID=UPI003002F290
MNFKKVFALLLVLLMVFANSTMAAVGSFAPKSEREGITVTKGAAISLEEQDIYKDSDKVRVIVEVKGEPAITYATKKGLKFNELPKSTKKKLHAEVLETQKKVKSQLNSKSLKMEFKHNFTTAFNGFSGVVEYGMIPKIKKLTGVTDVRIAHEYERPVEEPTMKYSKEIIEAQKAWEDYGLNGEGMIVGIIDSGVDPSHKDMVLTSDDKATLSNKTVEGFISENDLPGKFHTAKVPYGYNYMDENQEILDLGPEATHHGMHVAGTVAANGDEANGGIKGVAPEAQLLALKVFGNDPEMPSTWSDIYVKAIDDAIILGADVLNMSLGATAGFVVPEDAEQKAITKAVDNGILMSISAGNSAHLGNGWSYPWPSASNPDVGVIGSPGISFDSLQVASIENNYMDMDAVSYQFSDKAGLAPYLSASTVHPKSLEQNSFELVDAGLGGPDDFNGKDLTGKFALVKRGVYPFVDKALNAQAAGAAGVFIYNNADGTVSMLSDAAIKIPQLFMYKVDGDKLKAELDNGETVTITFGDEVLTVESPTAGKMSDFTSWGVAPNLDFKPEITAPGGNIYSTIQDNKYGVMSGTSMAAPHVSGGSAIVLQRVEEEFGLTGKARVELAKNILMNTAKPVVDKGPAQGLLGQENPYSPRRQGSGVMQIHSALSTPVVVTEVETGQAKVALKEVGDKFNFTLKATNYSNEAISYDVKANVQTDFAYYGDLGFDPNVLEAQELLGANVSVNGGNSVVEVPANGTVTFNVVVDLTDAVVLNYDATGFTSPKEIFENGYFVEGFVTLSNLTQPEISVPYVGYNGDWNKPPVLDGMVYDEVSFYQASGMVNENGVFLGNDFMNNVFDSSKIAFSPNGDGSNDVVTPVPSFLRNAKLVEYSVVDEKGNALRKIRTENYVRKNYYDGGSSLPYSYNPARAWDGKVKNKQVEDGEYFIEIATTIDYSGKEPQIVHIPVIVDTVSPELTAELKDGKLTYATTDDRSGVQYVDVFVNGESVFGEEDLPLPANGEEYTFANDIKTGSTVEVVAYDFAGNTDTVVFKGVNDTTIPSIFVKTPESHEAINKNEVTVSGYLTDESSLTDFTVGGESVELVWNEKEARFDFSTVITLEEGYHKIRIAGKDSAGNEISFLRHVFVDTTHPEINVEVPSSVSYNTDSFELSSALKDNFEELRYYVDGSEVFFNELVEPYGMNSIEKTVKTTLNLEPGDNTFLLEAVDLAGNKTVKEITINKEKTARIAGSDRYETSVSISADGWKSSEVVVLARGDNYADALAGVPLAAKYDAPVLLTRTKSMDNVTKAEIKRLGAKKVFILGSEAVVSKNIENELKALNADMEITRLAGKDRYET